MSTAHAIKERTVEQVWRWLEEVADPEIPVLSVVDLGIVRGVAIVDDGVELELSPTYSGCPATEVIEQSIEQHLLSRGIGSVSIQRVISPPWTTAWITADGRRKLAEYGIAPPVEAAGKRELTGRPQVACPRCGSDDTSEESPFGSTPCKSSYKCRHCLEPFEYFKCL